MKMMRCLSVGVLAFGLSALISGCEKPATAPATPPAATPPAAPAQPATPAAPATGDAAAGSGQTGKADVAPPAEEKK